MSQENFVFGLQSFDSYPNPVSTPDLDSNPNAAFRLACYSSHCRFDVDFCTTAQAALAAKERPSSEQRQAH